MDKTALIVGAGPGISGAFAHRLHSAGYKVALASRHLEKSRTIAQATGALQIQADAEHPEDVDLMFAQVDEAFGRLDVVLYNPSARIRAPFIELDREQVRHALMVTAYGAFLVAQEAAKRMLAQGSGAILFTGASAGVKGFAQSATFAMGKFALRGLAQSLARELHPQNIHVIHAVIDGAVAPDDPNDARLDPDAIAQTYLALLEQPRSAWAWEIELRPWIERF